VPVRLTSREALRIFDVADIWAARTGNSVLLVSANDHAHARGSAHYLGLALDFHSSDPDALAATLRAAGYHVLWKVPGHYAHVHVEDGSHGASAHPLHAEKPVLREASAAPGRSGDPESHAAALVDDHRLSGVRDGRWERTPRQ
jgi:hypothetical protein